jgi:hypothetical protein
MGIWRLIFRRTKRHDSDPLITEAVPVALAIPVGQVVPIPVGQVVPVPVAMLQVIENIVLAV